MKRSWASIEYAGHNVHIPGTTAYLRSRTFQSYFNMMVRCHYSSHKAYKDYGGRGIKVTRKWLGDFEQFLRDMGHRPHGHTLDRKNVNRGYSPSNCRWATPSQQARNRR